MVLFQPILPFSLFFVLAAEKWLMCILSINAINDPQTPSLFFMVAKGILDGASFLVTVVTINSRGCQGDALQIDWRDTPSFTDYRHLIQCWLYMDTDRL